MRIIQKLLVVLSLVLGIFMVRAIAFTVLLDLKPDTFSKQSLSFYLIFLSGVAFAYVVTKTKLFRG